MKQGSYRPEDCETEGMNGTRADGAKDAMPGKPMSTAERRYFSASPSKSRY
ncbi:hypothetical protein ACL02P_06365 [Paenibacillus sp. MB22_1]|uniref:hypothetical protein n=1 Tax=Paenibacillus sp. MB22_1 TaxID=3383121 RepID=UPI0039A06992